MGDSFKHPRYLGKPPVHERDLDHEQDVSPELPARVKKCFFSYNFSPNLKKQLPGNDTFLPINFDHDFATVMEVDRKTPQPKAGRPYPPSKLSAHAARRP